MDDVAAPDSVAEPPLPVLGAEFPTPTLEQWRGLVDAVLDRSRTAERAELDARFERQLVSTTYDGLRRQPLYTRADARPEPGVPGREPFVRGRTAAGRIVGGWDVRQGCIEDDPAQAAEAILADLEGGATSILLRVGTGGLPVDGLASALKGVHLELAGVVLEAWTDADALAAADALITVWDERLSAPEQALGSLGLDPIGTQARTGQAVDDLADHLARAQRVLGRPGVTAFVADGRPVHEAGGSDADELGYVLAVGAAYLRALLAAGVPVDDAAAAIELRLVATADQFATIAKLRAARRTWARITQVAGASDAVRAPKLHAVTSWSMASRRDPWVNLLRTTVAAFAAGTGGADAVTVLPFDAAIGRPDAFGRRLARNIQALLIDESNIARVIDPAGGSWFVEAFTDDLADVAWTWFRELEGAGGVQAALVDGLVDERCAASRAVRTDAIAHRRDPLTGVSEFPDVHEAPVVRAPDAEPPSGGLPRMRYAEGFEALRDASDAAAAAGATPTVHLLALGSVADSTARATFAKNFFEAGGIRTELHTVLGTDVEAANLPAGATVCLCSSDTVYADAAADAARAAKASGASRVLLAGKPRERDTLVAAGVDEFIHVGVDVLDVLERTLTHLGVRL